MNALPPHRTRTHRAAPPLPVVLCHAACSGGSLIFRILVTTLDYCGLNEIGVSAPTSRREFNPWDPERQLLLQGLLDPLKFSDVLYDRVENCREMAWREGRRLLLREHTHSFHFDLLDERLTPTGGSWFADQARKRGPTSPPLLVSVRDPIDSWLGFRHSFPAGSPRDFGEYCERYLGFLDRVERDRRANRPVFQFKYEDLLDDPQGVFDQVLKFIGESPRTIDLSTVGQVLGSGNSGRQSHRLAPRPRRPYSRKFAADALGTPAYLRLAERLGYPYINSQIAPGDYLRHATYNGVNLFVSRPLRFAESSSRWMRGIFRTVKNLQ